MVVTKNFGPDKKYFYEIYRDTLPDKKKFDGVTFKELPDLVKHLFEVNISWYALEPT